MNLRAASAPIFSPEQLWPRGRSVLVAALGAGLLGVLYMVWKAPDAIIYLPVVIAAAIGGALLLRYPLANLFVLLVGFACIANVEAGFQIQEVLYGLYFFTYMGCWFITRLATDRPALFEYLEDRMLTALLLWTVPAFALVFLFHGNVRMAFSEWEAFLMLSIYFPVREACVRYRNGTKVVLAALFAIFLFVSLRNLWQYHNNLADAVHAWQVERGRVITNDNVLMTGSVISLALLVFADRWRARLSLLGVFLLSFLGLILTLTRGFWVAFAVGACALFLVIGAREKRRMTLFALCGVAGLVLIGTVFFGDLMAMVVQGLVRRFASISTSTTQDPSLINRLREAGAVWTWIAANPVMGYGLGVPYHFYDMNYDITIVRSFMHNGYLSLWFRFGIFGLLLALSFWAIIIFRAFRAFRAQHADLITRLCGLTAGCTLVAFILPTLTSNPFFNDDHLFLLGLLAGLATGAYRRTRLQSPALT